MRIYNDRICKLGRARGDQSLFMFDSDGYLGIQSVASSITDLRCTVGSKSKLNPERAPQRSRWHIALCAFFDMRVDGGAIRDSGFARRGANVEFSRWEKGVSPTPYNIDFSKIRFPPRGGSVWVFLFSWDSECVDG